MTAQEKREYAIKLNADFKILRSRLEQFSMQLPYEEVERMRQRYFSECVPQMDRAMHALEGIVQHMSNEQLGEKKGEE